MTPAILFLLCFGISLRLMAPGLALEDSGEFATAAVTLTLTHPPGYPLYVLAGKLASLLPAGSVGFRLECLSAASTALAAVFIYACARECLGTGRVAAAGCALAVAWAPAAALQSSIADKYPLNLALLCALIWLAWRAVLPSGRTATAGLPAARAWRGGPGRLSPVAFLGGLSLAHHMMTLYLAPAVLGLAWRARLWKNQRRLAVLLLLGALGFSLKPIALPLLSVGSPSLMYARLDSAGLLRRYLSARDYEGRFAAYTTGQKIARVGTTALKELGRQAGWPLAVLAVLGATSLLRNGLPPLLAGVAGGGIAVWLVSSFQIAGVGYYLLPVVAFLALAAAAGLTDLASSAASVGVSADAETPRPADRYRGAIAALLGVLVALHAARNLPAADLARYFGALDWGRNLLASTPRNGVLVTQHDDDFYPAVYAQRVLGEKPDVVIVHRPFLTRLWHHTRVEELHPGFRVLDPAVIPWGRTVEPEVLINIFLRSHLGKCAIEFTYLANAECAGGFKLMPDGCLFRVGRTPTESPLPRVPVFAARLGRLRWRSVFAAYPTGSRFAEVAGAPAASWTQLAVRWWDAGRRTEARAALDRAARYPYTRVVREDLDRLKAAVGTP